MAGGASARASTRPAGRRAAATSRRRGAPARRARRARDSAVETVGRRAPTSWPRMRCVSASGITTPVAADAAPALGQVPEQRLQAPVDACELRDRLRRRQAQRALRQAVEQRCRDLGVLRHLGREAAVEHGERGRARARSTPRRPAAARSSTPAARGGSGRRGRAARRSRGRRRSAHGRSRRRGRAGRCDRRSRPRGGSRPRVRRARRCVLTSSRRSASERRGSASSPPRSGSALSREICSVLMRGFALRGGGGAGTATCPPPDAGLCDWERAGPGPRRFAARDSPCRTPGASAPPLRATAASAVIGLPGRATCDAPGRKARCVSRRSRRGRRACGSARPPCRRTSPRAASR